MKKWGLWIMVFTVLASCSDKKGQLPDTGIEYALLLKPAILSVLSKAESEMQYLPKSTELGVYALDDNEQNPATGDNRRNVLYRVTDEEGSISSLSPTLLEKGHSYHVFAYAPIQATAPEDNTILTVRHGEDILYAAPTPLAQVSENNHVASLQFTHRMAQIQFVLVPAQGLNEKYLKGAIFEISGFYESAHLNLKSGTMSAFSEQTATVRNLPDQLQTESICVIPDIKAQTLIITLTTDKKGKQTKIFDFHLESGKSYQFSILYNSALDLEITTSVNLWKEMNGGNITIGGGK